MNNKVSILIAVSLLACSMGARAAPPVAAAATPPSTAPGVIVHPLSKQIEALLPKLASKGLPNPRACYLGGDCLTLDTHPFELCHVAMKSCGDKLAEVLQVDEPQSVTQPAPRWQRVSR